MSLYIGYTIGIRIGRLVCRASVTDHDTTYEPPGANN